MLQLLFGRARLTTLLFLSVVISVPAQTKDNWKRVYTGEESIIEINLSSSKLEPDHILRTDFRTVLAKAENISGDQKAKYNSRIETFRFNLRKNRYRLSEMTWFDAKGTKLQSYVSTGEDWRVLKQGSVMERLFNSALTLFPFGTWKVVDYKFADGNPTREADLEKLVGTHIRFQADRAEIGEKVCLGLAYEDRRVSREELNRQLAVKLEAIGINAEYAETTQVKCELGNWTPPQSLLLKVKQDEMLMLRSGVFLVLKTDREWSGDIFTPLKRRP